MPYLRYWLLSEEYNKKAECAAPCFFILWRFRLCFLRKTGTWRDDAFLRAAGAVAAPPAPPPGLRPCRHTPSPRAFRPQPFRTSQALSRRRFLRRGRTLGCACGPSAGLAAAPSPPFSGALAAAATVPALFLNSRFFSVRGNYFGIIVEFILAVVCVQTVYLLLYIIKLSVAEAHDIRRLQQRGNKSFVAGKVHLRFRCIAIAG